MSPGKRGTLRRMAGRNPEVGEKRDQYLRVRVAGFEMDNIDTARLHDGAELSRSDYIRDLIDQDLRRKGLGGLSG